MSQSSAVSSRPLEGEKMPFLKPADIETPSQTSFTEDTPVSKRRNISIFLLTLTTIFVFADQNTLAPNLTPIAREFGFSDQERDKKLGGDIAAVFFLLGGIASVVVGFLADIYSRKKLFCSVIILAAIPGFCIGWVKTYEELFWLRAMSGIGVGGALPLVYSIVGDWYPPDKRSSASAVMSVAMGFGMLYGQVLSAAAGTVNWRLPFIIVAVPNIILATVTYFVMEEPLRGQSEEALKELYNSNMQYEEKLNFKDFLHIFTIKTNIVIILQALPCTLPWGVMYVYFNDFMVQNKGLSITQSSLCLVFFGMGGSVGCLSGGVIGDRIYRKNPAYLPVLCAFCTVAAAIPIVTVVNWPRFHDPTHGELFPIYFLTVIGAFFAMLPAPNLRVMLLNVNVPETRGSVFGLYNIFDDLGKGFGPVIVSELIMAMGNRESAFSVSSLCWIVCGLVILLSYFTFPQDEASMRDVLRRNSKARIEHQSPRYISGYGSTSSRKQM
eukprot:GILI01021086.1.p1 GENE.GILI01021086.1~~GILI01021086.1.p1  ORF type:complete len:496 (-),score=67.72 GILI01021086.1:23-1510(-)